MTNVIGTRLRCAECGSSAVVTHPGSGALACCGKPMEAVGGAAVAAPDQAAG